MQTFSRVSRPACQKVGSGSNFQLDLANIATQTKDFRAQESKSIQQFLSGKLCSQEGTQSKLSLLKTWKRMRTCTPTHSALWLTHSPAAALACLFSLELTCYQDQDVRVSQETLECEGVSLLQSNSARTLNLPHKFPKDSNVPIMSRG